jgi:hypothetical protein
VTFSASAGICSTGSTSSLLKMIPISLVAGLKIMFTFSPECKPTPDALTLFNNVFYLYDFKRVFIKKSIHF